MELKDYTTEELKTELKRRAEVIRQKKESVPRCRNCKHLIVEEKNWWTEYKCGVRTYKMKGAEHNYLVKPCRKACEQYEKKGE